MMKPVRLLLWLLNTYVSQSELSWNERSHLEFQQEAIAAVQV